MKQLTPKEVAELQLQLMDKIHEFCEKNSLRYSISGGTLLGAIRHKGYIPWDDDIDIIMPRPDYNRFIKEFQNKYADIHIYDRSTDPDYVSAFAKVLDTRTFAIGPNIIDDCGIFIDIFPIDGMPEADDLILQSEIKRTVENIRHGGKYWKYTNSKLKKLEFFIKYLIKRISYPSTKNSFAKLDKIIAKYPFENSKYAGAIISQYGYIREKQPKEVFLEYQDIKFEDRTYRAIKNYHSYLSKLYGNYMELPPEKDRVPKHFTEVYLK